METYEQLKRRQQKEIGALPLGFAYNDRQFAEMMEKLGVQSPSELYRLGNTGAFHRKTDTRMIVDTFTRHSRERHDAIYREQGIDVEYLRIMFYEEMCDHEFGINSNGRTDVLLACDITEEEMAQPEFQQAWAAARALYWQNAQKNNWL